MFCCKLGDKCGVMFVIGVQATCTRKMNGSARKPSARYGAWRSAAPIPRRRARSSRTCLPNTTAPAGNSPPARTRSPSSMSVHCVHSKPLRREHLRLFLRHRDLLPQGVSTLSELAVSAEELSKLFAETTTQMARVLDSESHERTLCGAQDALRCWLARLGGSLPDKILDIFQVTFYILTFPQ